MTSNFFDELGANKDMDIIDNTSYRSIIGSLLFAATRTRPDIALAIGILSQYVTKPTDFLLRASKRVLAYLYTTRDYGLVYHREPNPSCNITSAADSDYAGVKTDRKSRSGFVSKLDSSTISWWSRKQGTTALSTCEAEYIAMTESCKDIMWLRGILNEVGIKQDTPTTLLGDNISSEIWASSEMQPRRAKHLDVRFNYIREKVMLKHAKPKHVDSDANIADGFTKPLPRNLFENFRNAIGVQATTRMNTKEE